MKAYLIIDVDIIDLDGFMEYAGRIPSLIDKHGGRYLVQGVVPRVIEGVSGSPQRSVVLEFPSLDAAESFLAERARSGLHSIWEKTTRSRILLVEGADTGDEQSASSNQR